MHFQSNRSSLPRLLLAALVLGAFSTACTNGFDSLSLNISADPTSTPDDTSGTSSSSAKDFAISSVNITAASSGGANAFTTQIYFDTSRSTQALNDVCNTNTSNPQASRPCRCEFTWSEVNDSTGSSSPISRTVTTVINTPQAASVTCPAPSVYSTEILDGTTIKIKLVPASGNPLSFTMNAYRYVKRSTAATGAFRDVNGNIFDNVLRYSCFEARQRGMDVRSRRRMVSNPSTGEQIPIIFGSRFCVTKASDDGSASDECEAAPPQVSAQSYYYNLYIPDSRRGEINPQNNSYVCPNVAETLRGGSGSGVQPDYWPLDQNFALSVVRTTDFKVGVVARSKIAGGDTGSVNSSCDTGTTSTSSSSSTTSPATDGMINKCLGFAMKPSSDGTCSAIQLADGTIRPTFRLRKFVALYPPIFDSDGHLIEEPQRTDQIYVLDRPINAAGVDPRKPYTMRGPKPCPFAYFDHRGVTSELVDADYVDSSNPADRRRRPGYVATNNPLWNGKNVDGIQFPNIDIRTGSPSSIAPNACSAVLPKLNWTTQNFSLVTPHISQNPIYKEVHIRPAQAWSPHYEEDTSFEACSPQSTPFIDPPLHFSRDPSSGNISWCAESYPSQNPDIQNIDRGLNPSTPQLPGLVLNFTSHVAKNSASNSCTRTQIDMTKVTSPVNRYPALPDTTAACPSTAAEGGMIAGVAWHPAGMSTEWTDLFSAGTACTSGGTQGPSGCVGCSANRCYYCADQTCDRTVVNQIPHIAAELSRYPLLARSKPIEDALAADSTYGCIVTFDGGGGKTGKATPSKGCCGATVRMDTGISGVTGTGERFFNRSSHLEPDVPCQIPSY